MPGNNNEAQNKYKQAQKSGREYFDACLRDEKDPYLPALDDLVPDLQSLRTQYLGLFDIPSELLVGTKTAGRQDAFAGNFMPLLDRSTEFGMKWVALCDSHIEEGIRDPIQCFEYLGKFYVQEGNKRVSVLLSFGAPKIAGIVTRIYPSETYTDPEELASYRAFLSFFDLTRLYTVRFSHPANYAKLLASLGMEPGHVWTDEERTAFSSRFYNFRNVFHEIQKTDFVDLSAAEALLCWLQVYSYESLKSMPQRELAKTVESVWPEMRLLSGSRKEPLSMKPRTVEKTFISKLFSSELSYVRVAFIHSSLSSGSNWVQGHENGAEWLIRSLGERVSVESFYADTETAEMVMERAIRNGAQVIFVTAPTLIAATRRVATLHPRVIMLVCALSMPMAGVRSYYSRIYEAKFIAGAIAGAMSDSDTIGYIAKYPIFGVPAEINAFALGARMTNHNARIALRWTGVSEDPFEELVQEGVTMISGMDIISRKDMNGPDGCNSGTFYRDRDGKNHILAAPCWYWGTFYERVMRYIINDEWDEVSTEHGSEVDYWWGLDSGVIDVKLSDELPYGVTQLAKILKKSIISGVVDIFKTYLVDNEGVLRNDATRVYTPEDIMTMDWLLDSVDGKIPVFSELLPMARSLTRILGVYRDEIPPEKEGFLL